VCLPACFIFLAARFSLRVLPGFFGLSFCGVFWGITHLRPLDVLKTVRHAAGPMQVNTARRPTLGGVTFIAVNAITVPPEGGDELAKRFAARAGAVDQQDGFEGFELLRPADDRTTWLVMTRWRDEDAFKAWVSSPAFQHGHAQRPAAAQSDGEQAEAPKPPVATSSELWQFTVEPSRP